LSRTSSSSSASNGSPACASLSCSHARCSLSKCLSPRSPRQGELDPGLAAAMVGHNATRPHVEETVELGERRRTHIAIHVDEVILQRAAVDRAREFVYAVCNADAHQRRIAALANDLPQQSARTPAVRCANRAYCWLQSVQQRPCPLTLSVVCPHWAVQS
jgi:hypothetical protein